VTRRTVRYLGRGEGVEQPDDVHVRGVEVPFREIDERRKIARPRIVRVQVPRAAGGGEEPIEWRGAVVVPVEERRRKIDEERVQAPREREGAADRLGPQIPHAPGSEVQIIAIRNPEDDVGFVLEDAGRRGGRRNLPMCLVSSEGRQDGEVRHVLYADDELALGGCHLDERVLFRQRRTVEPSQDRDAARSCRENPHRGRGLHRRSQDPLRQVEDERPSLDEIVSNRPSIRRENREQIWICVRVELPECAVVRADGVEGRPVGSLCVVEQRREGVSVEQPSRQVRPREDRVLLRREDRPDIDRFGPRRIVDDDARGPVYVGVDRGLRRHDIVGHVVPGRQI